MKESSQSKKVRKWATSNNVMLIKHYGGPFSHRAFPDLFGCYKGRFLAIELKAEGKEPTDAQSLTLRKIEGYGGYATWTDHHLDAIHWLKKIMAIIDLELNSNSQSTKRRQP